MPLAVIGVFTPVHMFYKSTEGEHLLGVPFFLIMFGRVMKHIAIDQYSPTHTQTPRHANVDTTPPRTTARLHTEKHAHKHELHAHVNKQTHLHEELCLLAHFPGYEMISIPLTSVFLPCTPPLYAIGAVG